MTFASHLFDLRLQAVSRLETSLFFDLVQYMRDLFLQIWMVFRQVSKFGQSSQSNISRPSPCKPPGAFLANRRQDCAIALDSPWRLWHKEHANDKQASRYQLNGKRRDPLRSIGRHVLTDSIADPEADACSCLNADLVQTNESATNRRRCEFCNIQWD